jgi:hemerythrin superfamily protein
MPQPRRRSASKKNTSRRRAPARRSPRKPDALQMLKQDHRKVEALFARFERTRGDAQKQRLAETICQELTLHAQLEEQVVYPKVRRAIGDDDLMNEADVEHASAKDLIRQIQESSPSDEHYDALVTVLGEYVKHHVKEEEGEMFKKVRKSELDLAALAGEMRERKSALAPAAEERGKGKLASFFSGS